MREERVIGDNGKTRDRGSREWTTNQGRNRFCSSDFFGAGTQKTAAKLGPEPRHLAEMITAARACVAGASTASEGSGTPEKLCTVHVKRTVARRPEGDVLDANEN